MLLFLRLYGNSSLFKQKVSNSIRNHPFLFLYLNWKSYMYNNVFNGSKYKYKYNIQIIDMT